MYYEMEIECIQVCVYVRPRSRMRALAYTSKEPLSTPFSFLQMCCYCSIFIDSSGDVVNITSAIYNSRELFLVPELGWVDLAAYVGFPTPS